jgi:single-strand DNA-binding protein
MSLNKVMLIGNVGKDPEVRHLESGVPVVTIPIATTERYKDKNGEIKEQTEWHNVVLWRVLAEFAEKYVHKGRQVYVEGKLRSRSWEDQSGQKRYTTEIVADIIRLLGKKSDNEQSGGGTTADKPVAPVDPPMPDQHEGDDLPF